jgi:signal transduction histidine kinase
MRGGPGGGTVTRVSWPQTLVTRARALNPMTVDTVVAVVLTVAAVASTLSGHHDGAVPVIAGGVCGATVAWRRVNPVITTFIAVVAITVYASATDGKNVALEPIAVLLNFYMLGRLSTDRSDLRVAIPLMALAVVAVALTPGTQLVSDVAAGWSLFVGVPFAGGRAIGSRAALTRELRDKAVRLERDQHERARRAAADERNRIARELHDVIAHNVSVMVIQTQAARRVARDDRQTARDALDAVESCGRDALTEMRRMMGVMRRGDEELAGAATPALSEVRTLIDRARAAGLPVELVVDGEPRELTPGLELVAFRIIQEALTNAIKHAGPATAVVRVAYAPEALELEISDTGHGPFFQDERVDGGGHGLVGMRERLHLYGGELQAGRRRGGGFRVRARIPLREAVAT